MKLNNADDAFDSNGRALCTRCKPTTPRHYDPTPSSTITFNEVDDESTGEVIARPKKKKRSDA